MSTSTERCEYCGSPGPFKGGACYGCIQLVNLANDLSQMQARLTTITAHLEREPYDLTSLNHLKLLCQDLSEVLAQIDRYTHD